MLTLDARDGKSRCFEIGIRIVGIGVCVIEICIRGSRCDWFRKRRKGEGFLPRVTQTKYGRGLEGRDSLYALSTCAKRIRKEWFRQINVQSSEEGWTNAS